MNSRNRRKFILAGLSLTASFPLVARSLSYPERTITLIVPSQAGGGTDAIARALAPELAQRLKQSVIVENSAGASGTIGAVKALNAAPDGYTLLVANSDLVLAPLIHKPAPYTLKDVAPIAYLTASPLSLVARPGFAASNVEQLVALAKAKPGTITVGVSGVAALPTLGLAMLEQAANISFLAVPYKGASQVITDLLGGQVDVAVTALVGVLPHARSGKLKMLGLLSDQRAAVAPEVPLLADTPVTKNVKLDIWAGLFGSSKLPAAIVDILNLAVQDIQRQPSYAEARAKLGEIPATPGSAETFARFVASEELRYRAASAKLKIK